MGTGDWGGVAWSPVCKKGRRKGKRQKGKAKVGDGLSLNWKKSSERARQWLGILWKL